MIRSSLLHPVTNSLLCPVADNHGPPAIRRLLHNKGNYDGFSSRTTTLRVTPYFSNPDVHPYDEVEWEDRTAAVKNHATGEYLFKQEAVHFPKHFSQNATNIVASKYFYGAVDAGNGDPADGRREYSLQQLIDRVVDAIAVAGVDQGLLTPEDAVTFRVELKWLLVNQYGSFNSPVWFNVGLGQAYGLRDDKKDLFGWEQGPVTANGINHMRQDVIQPVDPYERPQASACFIIGLEDSIEGIWETMQESARLFKYGSGVGSDWSVLRSTKDMLSGGGEPSGPVSFMKVQDATGGAIKSEHKERKYNGYVNNIRSIHKTSHDNYKSCLRGDSSLSYESERKLKTDERNYSGKTGTIAVKEATSRFLALTPTLTPMNTDKKPDNPGDGPSNSGFSYAAASFADWLAHRFRPHDPWRHALAGLARYLRRRH